MSIATLVSAEQFLRMPNDGCRYDLIAGEIRKTSPTGWKHGDMESRLDRRLSQFVEERRLGLVITGDSGFLLARDPDTVLCPDIAFVRKDRLPAQPPDEAFWQGPPDLAVEVASPGDTLREIDEKAKAWLDAGAALVWIVNPAWRTVTVYRSATDIQTLTAPADLTAPDLLPGFRCPIAELFAAP